MALPLSSAAALGVCRLPAALAPAGWVREQVSSVRPAPRRTFRRRAVIYGCGDPADHVFVLERGRVKLYRLLPDGHEITLGILEPGEAFGEEALFGAEQRPLYAEALETSCVRLVAREQIEALAQGRPDVLLELAQCLWLRLEALGSQLDNLAFHTVSQRLAGLLVQWADKYGVPTPAGVRLRIRLAHAEIANLIASSRPTVTQALGQLVRAGLIAHEPSQGRSIAIPNLVIPDVERLARYANPEG